MAIARSALITWESISDRIMAVGFQPKIWNVSIVHYYAPVEISNARKK